MPHSHKSLLSTNGLALSVRLSSLTSPSNSQVTSILPAFLKHYWSKSSELHWKAGTILCKCDRSKITSRASQGTHCTQAQNKPNYLLFRKTPLRNSGVRTTQRMRQSTLNSKEMFYSKVFVVNEHKRNPYPTVKRTAQRGKQTSYPPLECNEVQKEQG